MTLKQFLASIDEDAKRKKLRAKADFNAAVNDCRCGLYDKWFRYHREDSGLAYDVGWMHANETIKVDKVTFNTEDIFP